jgi:hypothetical protein
MPLSDEFRAVLHDAAVTRLLCGIPATLLSPQLKEATSAGPESGELGRFDYVGAATRLLCGLRRAAQEGCDCWAVLQLHAVADENGMLLADCVLAVERFVWC